MVANTDRRSRKRIGLFAILVAIAGSALVLFGQAFLSSVAYGLTAFYMLWGCYHMAVALAGIGGYKKSHGQSQPTPKLPKISVIIPARKEPILGRTIEACLKHTDYPLDKKEIVVVVDDVEGERIGFWYQQRYPQNVKLLSRRRMYPTKPSALNDSIHLCTGEIIAIMDVEDIPDRDVFLKAAAALASEQTVAAQVILRISNPQDSWISKVFAMEYAGWFRVLLNGRSKLGMYTPLGGTGNYFKKSALSHVGLYDPTNLAEDAELSIRLLMAGWNVKAFDSRHWEEAPVTFNAWLKQRTRWYRGWLQSLWKYIPVMLDKNSLNRLGALGAFSTLMMLVSPLIVALNWVSYGFTAAWALEVVGLMPIKTISSISLPFWSMVPASFNLMYFWIWLKGASLEGIPLNNLHRVLPQMLWYVNVMMPIAACRALYQEIFKPVVWEKTAHEGRGVTWGTLTS